jgi:DNA polymerase I-like protein with 3'-5' exonuclease and polymerase domains
LRIIKTHETDMNSVSDWDRSQIYNGLDVCCTHDVFAATHPQLDHHTEDTYAFSRSLQGPVLEMRIRGVLVDLARRSSVVDEICDEIDWVEGRLNQLVIDGVGMSEFNWRSNAHLQKLFYGELGIYPITRAGRPTTDRSAREKLESHPLATQLIRHINTLVELGDKLSVLRTEIDPDGRIRTSYNIAGTSTGRFSSSLSEFGTGGNLQNIEESLRSILIADPGYKFCKLDAKSGESFCVGAIEWNLFRDGAYLDACESGDPHTAVARLVWPDLGWIGDDLRANKKLAERPFYRHYSYRFMCKKLGHGSNYGGKPATLAGQAKLPVEVVSSFQPKYFSAFPAHQRWHSDVDDRLRRLGYLISLTGRKRYFFGRRSDPSTLREAIAYDPQGSLADIVNAAMLKLWRMNIAIVMMQDHDAITFMYKEADEEHVVAHLLRELIIPIPLADGRVLRIPYDAEVGWNKGHASDSNPDGLIPWSGHDPRKRQPIRGLMDSIVTKKLVGVR